MMFWWCLMELMVIDSNLIVIDGDCDLTVVI